MDDPTESATTGTSAGADPSPALLDALWAVVARHGWHGTTFARVAAESGESLASLRSRYATPVDLLRAHARAVDRFVLEGTVPEPDGTTPARDRLFDLLMRRFDALAPHRQGILRLQRDLMRDPISALMLSPILLASMAWTLEGAGVPASGPAGALRVHGLTGVWLATSRTWAEDESADLGATMAALDRALDRAEAVARTLRLDAGEASPAVAAPPDAAGDAADTVSAAAERPASGRFPDLPDASPDLSPASVASEVTPPVPDNPPDALGPESPGEGPDTAKAPSPD